MPDTCPAGRESEVPYSMRAQVHAGVALVVGRPAPRAFGLWGAGRASGGALLRWCDGGGVR
jgi:hypothetical protein